MSAVLGRGNSSQTKAMLRWRSKICQVCSSLFWPISLWGAVSLSLCIPARILNSAPEFLTRPKHDSIQTKQGRFLELNVVCPQAQPVRDSSSVCSCEPRTSIKLTAFYLCCSFKYQLDIWEEQGCLLQEASQEKALQSTYSWVYWAYLSKTCKNGAGELILM